MGSRSKFSLLALSLAVVLVLCGSAWAKSLFLIANINAYPTPVDAYNIKADGTIVYQAQYGVPNLGGGAVGIAMDTPSNTLFVTYEFSNNIQLLNAQTMTDLGAIAAPGAYNLAGIVMDEKKKLLYTMDRTTNNLFVYKWDAVNKKLTLVPGAPFSLANVGGQLAWGIGLDVSRGHLYVANLTNSIPYYSTTDWSYKGRVETTGTAINVAVDHVRQFLYSGAGDFPGAHGPFTPNDYLDQVNLATGAKKRVLLGTPVGIRGVGVDTDTGMVYLTTGNEAESVHDLRVYTSALTLKQNAGSPAGASGLTGLVVPAGEGGYNPLNLAKIGTPLTIPGKTITYTIHCDNKQNIEGDVHNVTITDKLPSATTFVSLTGPGTYNSATRTVTWNLGTLPAGGGATTVKLMVRVNGDTPPGTIISNAATIKCTEIVGETTSKAAPPTVVSFAFPLNGYTPFTAPVEAVLDHSVFDVNPVKFYVKDGKVRAFNAETGLRAYGSKSLDIYDSCVGYKNSDGTPFLKNVLNYTGGAYLFYDGHAGYDYPVPTGSTVKATGPGKLYKANTDPVNGGGWSVYKTCYINHGNGSYSWYLYVNMDPTLSAKIKNDGFAPVTRGQTIGKTSVCYLHFEVRQGGIGPSNVKDPYKEKLW